jgi:uncharacterized protein YcfJ
MKKYVLTITLLSVGIATVMAGCETTPVQDGALLGGALGAGAGAIIGNQSYGRSGEGALIGAAAGALAGALIGDQVQRSRSEPYAYSQQSSSTTRTVTGHYENRIVRTPSGETYEERVWVPD